MREREGGRERERNNEREREGRETHPTPSSRWPQSHLFSRRGDLRVQVVEVKASWVTISNPHLHALRYKRTQSSLPVQGYFFCLRVTLIDLPAIALTDFHFDFLDSRSEWMTVSAVSEKQTSENGNYCQIASTCSKEYSDIVRKLRQILSIDMTNAT